MPRRQAHALDVSIAVIAALVVYSAGVSAAVDVGTAAQRLPVDPLLPILLVFCVYRLGLGGGAVSGRRRRKQISTPKETPMARFSPYSVFGFSTRLSPRAMPVFALLLLTSGCGGGTISWQPMVGGETQGEARRLLDGVIEAHGGDAWAEVADVYVSYEGTWGGLVPKMQPVLSDRFFRRTSREVYWPSAGLVAQHHRGPAGEKRVLRGTDSVEVSYRDEGEGSFRSADADEQAASALVADAYALFLFGPSFISHHAETLQPLPDDVLDGKTYHRLLAGLRPGFGFSQEDRVVLWIDSETKRLFRVLFSLEGFASTQGAEVDVTFLSYREQGGYWWPDEFRERVRAPVRAFAHAWRTVELRVESGVAKPDKSWAQGVGESAFPALTGR